MITVLLAWSLDFGSSQLAGILIGSGVILGGIWWWEKHRFRLPEIKIWDVAVTRGFLEEHNYFAGFYERRLKMLTQLTDRLPEKRKAAFGGLLGEIAERLEDYREVIEENENREVIQPANRWTIVSREAAVQEPLQKLALRVAQWYQGHSRHEKLKGSAQGVSTVLARVPLLRDYFEWKRMLVFLAERAQSISARQMVSFRLAEKGSALHVRANGFFRQVRTPAANSRAVRQAHRMFRRKLVRFARAVMEAQVEGGEKTLVLHGVGNGKAVPEVKGGVTLQGAVGRHDPLSHLKRKKPEPPPGEVALSNDGLESLRKLWERFERIAAPSLSHYDGYLNFVVFEKEIPGASHPELESALKRCMRVRVLDKVTGEWEKVKFEVHFGRYLVFKADWLARACELELRMSSRQKEKAKGFILETVEHRAVSIHPKKPGT